MAPRPADRADRPARPCCCSEAAVLAPEPKAPAPGPAAPRRAAAKARGRAPRAAVTAALRRQARPLARVAMPTALARPDAASAGRPKGGPIGRARHGRRGRSREQARKRGSKSPSSRILATRCPSFWRRFQESTSAGEVPKPGVIPDARSAFGIFMRSSGRSRIAAPNLTLTKALVLNDLSLPMVGHALTPALARSRQRVRMEAPLRAVRPDRTAPRRA